jgi:hypothetical protein
MSISLEFQWSKENPQCVRARGSMTVRREVYDIQLRQVHLGLLHADTISYADVDGRLLVTRADGSGRPPSVRLMVEAKHAVAEALDAEATRRDAY